MSQIPRSVWLLGWSSLCTDAATEMIYPLLPVYLSRVLGAGALSLGIIEGVAEAANSVLKILSGYLSDRWARRRPIVIGGYSLSSAARPLIAMTATWPQVLLIRTLDRMGKGIRGAPRDAMLARFSAITERGRVFGFHRAMDHTGAIIGPLVATAVLLFAPGQYRLLFALTVIPGAIAVALLFFVPEPEAPTGPQAVKRAPDTSISIGRDSKQFLAFLAILLLFSLGNSADAFLLLRLSEEFGSATYVPLLWSALHVVKASLSTWGGTLSDRFGRRPVISIGWLIYALVYMGFAMASRAQTLAAWFLVYGVFFALTEGAEKALVADLAPADKHGLAFGLYNTALGIGALTASVVFGLLYEWVGPPVAFGSGSALAAMAAVLLSFLPTSPDPGAMMGSSNASNSSH